MDHQTIPEIRFEALELPTLEAQPEQPELCPAQAKKERVLPAAVLVAALLLIAVSLVLHTSLVAMAADYLSTTSPQELLLPLILPGYTAQNPPEKDQTKKDSVETPEDLPNQLDNPAAQEDNIRNADLSSSAENGFSLTNQTSYQPDLWMLYGGNRPAQCADELFEEYGENAPLVLILHSHGTESYENGDTVTAATGFRSRDPEKTVVAVGSVMKEVLEDSGIPTIHLEEMFDSEDWSAAYNNSSAAVRETLEKYPSIQYIFDVHRDSIGDEDNGYVRAVTQIAGQSCAQLMLVCGTDEGGSGHTQWRDNLTVALSLQADLHSLHTELMRPINLRTASFYQDLRSGSLLLECGTSANSLAEAKRSAALFSASLAAYIQGKSAEISPQELFEQYCK